MTDFNDRKWFYLSSFSFMTAAVSVRWTVSVLPNRLKGLFCFVCRKIPRRLRVSKEELSRSLVELVGEMRAAPDIFFQRIHT